MWRKTKQEQVDDKIERMLETYKLMDEVAYKKRKSGPDGHKQRLAEKYFPTDEDNEEEGEDEDEDMEDIINDDDGESEVIWSGSKPMSR